MTHTAAGDVFGTLVRRFADLDEFNAAANRARLTPVGLVLPQADTAEAPLESVLGLDWRLEDGSPLVIARAELVEVRGNQATLRVLELDPTCRVARIFSGEIERPRELRAPAPDQDDTVSGLVERTYRGGAPGHAARAIPVSTEVFLPPDPEPQRAPVPAPVEPEIRAADPDPEVAPTAFMAPLAARRGKPRRTLQVAAVIGVACALGFGARFAFPYFEPMVTELLADSPAVDSGALDVPPAGIQPSRLPTPAPEPAHEPAPQASDPAEPGADTAPAAPAPAPTGRALDRLRAIRWEREGDSTIVTLWGNGTAYEERLIHTRLDAPQPRELLKVRGVDLPFREAALAVGTPELDRIRVGFHPKPLANELHIVLDLPDHRVALTDMQVDGQNYRLVLTRKP